MRLTYVGENGQQQIRPRYKWAFWAFWAGLLVGVVLEAGFMG
jgi:hypothetical protein